MNQRDRILALALSQLGVTSPESRKYMREMFPYIDEDADWCAAFVSWCAKNTGVSAEIFPYHASCTLGRGEWQKRGVWKSRSYTPQSGDVIYFDWDKSGDCDHVGFVTDVSGGRISTVEGNKSRAVARGSYALGDANIAGFAVPKYDERDNEPQSWAKNAVEWALGTDVLLGDGDGNLRLRDAPTREETVAMLFRARGK